jgi:hypothetical protein
MTAPIIRTDPAVVAETAAELRGLGEMISSAADSAAAAVAAASAQPVPTGARPSPAMAAMQSLMPSLVAATKATSGRLTDAATQLTGWSGSLVEVQATGAEAVAAQSDTAGGGGGSW